MEKCWAIELADRRLLDALGRSKLSTELQRFILTMNDGFHATNANGRSSFSRQRLWQHTLSELDSKVSRIAI